MNLYLDATALVKRYVAEPDSELVRKEMQRADGWFICRCGFVETVRAVAIAAGVRATRHVKEEWPTFALVEVDQPLVEHAAELAISRDLRTLDSLHLAAGLLLPGDDLVFATWDRRLHTAAREQGMEVLPETIR